MNAATLPDSVSLCSHCIRATRESGRPFDMLTGYCLSQCICGGCGDKTDLAMCRDEKLRIPIEGMLTRSERALVYRVRLTTTGNPVRTIESREPLKPMTRAQALAVLAEVLRTNREPLVGGGYIEEVPA